MEGESRGIVSGTGRRWVGSGDGAVGPWLPLAGRAAFDMGLNLDEGIPRRPCVIHVALSGGEVSASSWCPGNSHHSAEATAIHRTSGVIYITDAYCP